MKENKPLSAVCLTDCSYLVFKDSTSAIDDPYVIYGEGWNTELNLGTTYNIDGNIVQQFQFYKDKIIELNFDFN